MGAARRGETSQGVQPWQVLCHEAVALLRAELGAALSLFLPVSKGGMCGFTRGGVNWGCFMTCFWCTGCWLSCLDVLSAG